MKGRPANPCTNSYARVPLRECVLNGEGKHVALCHLCTRYMFVRVRIGNIAAGRAIGVLPRHNTEVRAA